MPLLAALFLLLQPMIRVRTELVALPVTVIDARGHQVSGLTQENFRILEEGRSQTIALFDHGDTPVTLGLIVDRSQSMRAKSRTLMRAVSSLLQSGREGDELFAMAFNDRVSLVSTGEQAFTTDVNLLEALVSETRAAGRTALYDGVAEGLRHMRLGHAQKHALVIISDGGDNGSRLTYDEILAMAHESDAVIYAVGLLGTPPAEEEENEGLLKRLCRDTGGVAFFPRSEDEVGAVARGIAHDLREQYTLGFIPSERVANPRAFRRIQVKVVAPGQGRLRVRTRPGYAIPGPDDKAKEER